MVLKIDHGLSTGMGVGDHCGVDSHEDGIMRKGSLTTESWNGLG